MFCWIIFQMCRIDILPGHPDSLSDLPPVQPRPVSVQGTLARLWSTLLAVEMAVVVLDRFPADVAHGGPTLARHLVTPVFLKEAFLAGDALADHGLRGSVLQESPRHSLTVPLHLCTCEGQVTVLEKIVRIVQTLATSPLHRGGRFPSCSQDCHRRAR